MAEPTKDEAIRQIRGLLTYVDERYISIRRDFLNALVTEADARAEEPQQRPAWEYTLEGIRDQAQKNQWWNATFRACQLVEYCLKRFGRCLDG